MTRPGSDLNTSAYTPVARTHSHWPNSDCKGSWERVFPCGQEARNEEGLDSDVSSKGGVNSCSTPFNFLFSFPIVLMWSSYMGLLNAVRWNYQHFSQHPLPAMLPFHKPACPVKLQAQLRCQLLQSALIPSWQEGSTTLLQQYFV